MFSKLYNALKDFLSTKNTTKVQTMPEPDLIRNSTDPAAAPAPVEVVVSALEAAVSKLQAVIAAGKAAEEELIALAAKYL